MKPLFQIKSAQQPRETETQLGSQQLAISEGELESNLASSMVNTLIIE